MGNTDSIPLVSQAKSLVQVIGGNSEGARQTQENFLLRNTFPVLSQATSLGYAIAGETDKARELQEEFARNLDRVVDSIPVAGHVKGVVHFALGDGKRAEQAMIAANRATGVAAGGVGGFFVGGPAGAFAGGVAGGQAMDTLHTGVEVAVNGPEKAKGHGIHGLVDDLVKTGGEGAVGKIFDAGVGIAMDGMGGLGTGKMVGPKLPGPAKVTGGGAGKRGGSTTSKTGRGCPRGKRQARSACQPEGYEMQSLDSSGRALNPRGSGSVSTSGLRIGGVSLKTAAKVVGGIAVVGGITYEAVQLGEDLIRGGRRNLPRTPPSSGDEFVPSSDEPQSPYPENINCADIIQDINDIRSDRPPALAADVTGQIAEFRRIRCDLLEAQTRVNHGVWRQLRGVMLNGAHPANLNNPIREYFTRQPLQDEVGHGHRHGLPVMLRAELTPEGWRHCQELGRANFGDGFLPRMRFMQARRPEEGHVLDERGHLLGDQFCGPVEWYNLAPQTPRVNRNEGGQPLGSPWERLETFIGQFLRGSCGTVNWKVHLLYIQEESRRPRAFKACPTFQEENGQPYEHPDNWNGIYSDNNI